MRCNRPAKGVWSGRAQEAGTRRPEPDEWLELVNEDEGSGLTQKEFVARHDVHLGTFQYWLYREAKAVRHESDSRQRFLPVVALPSPALEARAAAVELPAGAGEAVALLPSAVRILLAVEPTDMRNSIDGLVALVRANFGEDVFTGHLFVFISRRRDRVKILTWDSGGFIVFYKRLEQGRFRRVVVSDDARVAHLAATQLAMLLDGIDVSRVRRPPRWNPPRGNRQTPGSFVSTAQRDAGAPAQTDTSASGATSTPRSRPSWRPRMPPSKP